MIVAMLFYNDEARFAALTTAERNALVERHITYNTEVLQKRSLMMVNRALQPTFTARTVWPSTEHAAELSDRVRPGPFDETSLCMSGFYLVDCADLDEATELAAAYPMPPDLGCVEVRPVLQDWDYGPSVILDATDAQTAWHVYADTDRWSEWMAGVHSVALGSIEVGTRGRIQLDGAPTAAITVLAADPLRALTVRLEFPGADVPLDLSFLIEPRPRGAVEVTHRATVPRDLLDTLGTDFSRRLNADLRASVRALPSRTRLVPVW
jgi:hypothetical protein